MTAKPFYHPLIVVMSIAMVGLGLWFLAQGVYGLATESSLANDVPGSFGAQVDQKMLDKDYVSDGPLFIAGLIWLSLFAAAAVMSLVHGRLAILSWWTQGFRWDWSLLQFKPELTDQEAAEVGAWLEQSRMPLDQLKEVW
jgi:hypothetical protein